MQLSISKTGLQAGLLELSECFFFFFFATHFLFRLLSNLVKQKPNAAEMQFQSIIVNFAHLVEICCQAEKSETCFQEEVSLFPCLFS